ncbi:MAG TPA: FG-GAP-like repeat-containing protein [Gemmataceae bacterium]|nr:FG-GAP-like repeat-containing protein [Gemmataceae bacterium]
MSPRTRVAVVAAFLVLSAAAVWYFGTRGRDRATVDVDGAIAANNRGVGYIEQFKYEESVAAFRDAVARHPSWTVARINLAIGLLNLAPPDHHPEVLEILTQVLREHPDEPHAHYVLGWLYKFRGDLAAAYPHFDAVTRIDPRDAHSWGFKGESHPDGGESEPAIACYETALRLNPYLNVFRYRLMSLVPRERGRALAAEFEALRTAFWEKRTETRYFDMGPYGEVIGRTSDSHPPQPVGPIPAFEPWDAFTIQFAPDTRWTVESDDVRRRLADRFGRTMVLLDYNRDGRLDVFLVAAVVRSGAVQNLLLRNDGDGVFTDVTPAAGLAGASRDLGCSVADFDNDGRRDLLLTGLDGVRLLRNSGTGAFIDVTALAGFDKIGGVCLGAAWCDIDQDSDLDLIVCRYADTAEGAVALLDGNEAPGGRSEVWLNTGDAAPVQEGSEHPPLTVRFRRATEPAPLFPQRPMTGLVLSDLDADLDVDLLYLADSRSPAAVLNDRLLRFRTADGFPAPAERWNGGAVLDVNHDGRSDVVLLTHGKKPVVLLSSSMGSDGPLPDSFAVGDTNSPPLRQAIVTDLDADGWADLVGVSKDSKLVFLHNDGENRLVDRSAAIGVPLPDEVQAAAVADLNGDCHADLLVWSAGAGLKVLRGGDNGNRTLLLELTGRHEREATRTNADGIGCTVSALAGRHWTGAENTTVAAGLGQSRIPLHLGLGRQSSADTVRILWPDGVPQAELNRATCELHVIRETNRKSTSCPVLLVWDGEQFRYVTDFLGAGSVGESGADGSVRPPRPEESVKIEPGWLVARDGEYVIKVTEPMDELMYIDRLTLVAIDHPNNTQVHPDERFATADPPPTQELLGFAEPVPPVRATDHRGRDVTDLLRDRDHRTASGFRRRAWIGFAEEHFVELDFGDRLADLKRGERVHLVLTGWTDYAYPESIITAGQAGVVPLWPVLERLGPDGQWQSLGDLGFPAGLPRTITREVTGQLVGPTYKLRIRTNLHVHWDQIAVARLRVVAKPGRVHELPVERATLAGRGILQEIRPHGRGGPIAYDDARTETVAMTAWKGMLTRFGDVTALLTRDDDCFVIGGPGDELTAAFDARALPPVADGFVRSFVLRTWGYCKDAAPTTVTGGRVEPLPFRGRNPYPFYDAADRARAAAAQDGYRKRWNTRPAAGGP